MLINILFFGFASISVFSSILMIFFKNPINSAISFLITLLSIAGMYSIMNNPFLFIMQIIIYSGAVMVLILFIMMYLNIQKPDNIFMKNLYLKTAILLLLLVPFIYVFFASIYNHTFYKIRADHMIISVHNIGFSIFHEWFIPFEFISILLLVVLVGVVVLLTNKKGEK